MADDTSPFAAADAKILAEIHDHSEAAQNLEYISDKHRPAPYRFSATQSGERLDRRAVPEIRPRDVHLESWKIAHTWTRGNREGPHRRAGRASFNDRLRRFGRRARTAQCVARLFV